MLSTVPDSLRGGALGRCSRSAVALLVAHELTVGSSAAAIARRLPRVSADASADEPRRSRASSASRGACSSRAWSSSPATPLLAVAVDVAARARISSDRMPGPFPNDGTGGIAWFWQLHQEDGYSCSGRRTTRSPVRRSVGPGQRAQLPVAVPVLPRLPPRRVSSARSRRSTLVLLAGLVLSARRCISSSAGSAAAGSSQPGRASSTSSSRGICERGHGRSPSLVHLEVFPLLLLAGIAWVRQPDRRARALLVALAVVGCVAHVRVLRRDGARRADRSDRPWACRQPPHARLGGRVGRAAKVWAMAIIAGRLLVGLAVRVRRRHGRERRRPRRRRSSSSTARTSHDYLPDPANPSSAGSRTRVGNRDDPVLPGRREHALPGPAHRRARAALARSWSCDGRARFPSGCGWRRASSRRR